MNAETPHDNQDIMIPSQERRGMEAVLDEYIDTTICAPDTNPQRELAEHAFSLSRQIYHRQFDHVRFLNGLNEIALDESQPTYARIIVLRSILEYRNRFDRYREERHPVELDTITNNLVTLTSQWEKAEERETGFLGEAANQDVRRRQLLIYAAAYNVQRIPTPVDNRTEKERENSKWLRVAADLLRIKRLELHLPFKDGTTVENNQRSIDRGSSGYPYIRVLCPPNYMAEWDKFEEACAYGIPEKIAVFTPRSPCALVSVETQRVYTEVTADEIMRKSKINYLRLPSLPDPQAVDREMRDERLIVPEQTLVRSHMISNFSYVIAMRSIKDAMRRRSELGFGTTAPSRLVLDYVRKNVERITEPVTHPGYTRRVEAGLDTQASTILGLAMLQHRDETSRVWTDQTKLCNYLERAASSLAIRMDQQNGSMATRTFDEIHSLVVHRFLITQPINVLAEFSNLFLQDGTREFLNDTELAYVEEHEDELRRMLAMYRVLRIEQPDSMAASPDFPVEEWKLRFRRFLHHVMRVRFETIRDISISDIESIDWGENQSIASA
ncbi:MAG: hypothetical protein NUV98_01885 [Candidatus Roizmanbacteria bacterium]|nr:hypothetical protein [Candidatus Roizmanbacteria bacterium]